MLTSWAALVFLTAEEVGCPAGIRQEASQHSRPDAGRSSGGGDSTPGSSSSYSAAAGGSTATSGSGSGAEAGAGGSGGDGSGDGSATSLGLRRFVKQAAAQYAGGTRLADLMDLQVQLYDTLRLSTTI